MKNFFTFVLTLAIICALVLGAVYAIDLNRMKNGEEVLFSTWGKDYKPKGEAIEVSSSGEEAPTQTQKPTKGTYTLYFADENIMYLKGEERELDIKDGVPIAVAKALFDGPADENKYYPLISADTEVISADVKGDLCTINLNGEFSNFTLGSSMENMALYSLVNSLCSIDGINSVKINIEGNEHAMFGSHYSLEDPFKADMSLVK